MKRLIYFCNCLIRPAGYIDPFLVAEWPWLTAHFDRVDAVGELGVAELPREPVEALRFQKTRFAALRAALALPFRGEVWAETASTLFTPGINNLRTNIILLSHLLLLILVGAVI